MLFGKINKILDKESKIEAIKLTLALIISSIFEVIGLASVFPFLMSFRHGEEIKEYLLTIGINNSSVGITEIFGGIVIAFFGIGVVARYLGVKKLITFQYDLEKKINFKVLSNYIKSDYDAVSRLNVDDFSKNLLSEISDSIAGAVIPAITAISQGMLVVLAVCILIAVNPIAAGYVSIIIFTGYVLIWQASAKRIANTGAMRVESNKSRFKILRLMLSNLMMIKLYKKENFILKSYVDEVENYVNVQKRAQLYAITPKYAVELFMFIIIGIVLMISNKDASLYEALGLYAATAYRILPSIQQIYGSIVLIKHTVPTLNNTINRLNDERECQIANKVQRKLPIQYNSIELKDLSYGYNINQNDIFKEVNFKAIKGQITTIIGESGSGKTTLILILMGLLKPQKIEYFIDGLQININQLDAYWDAFSLVPQFNNMFEGNIFENISLMSNCSSLDNERIKKIMSDVSLNEFVESLPNGYQTLISNDGLQLSGGQSQRIGMARAIYRNPRILIIDEGTSALDGENAKKLIGMLESIKNKMIIICVSHSEEIISISDKIYKLSDRSLNAKETHDDNYN